MNQDVKKINKVVVNSGIGKLANEANFKDKILPELRRDFALISGQKPLDRPANISIAGFKIREGMIVGLKATLRGNRMSEFLNRLIKVVLPRIRDFKGISKKSIDAKGNLSIGIKENFVFPEIDLGVSKKNFGVEVSVVLKEKMEKDKAIEFYKKIGIPFKK